MKEKIKKIIMLSLCLLFSIANLLIHHTNPHYIYVKIAGYVILPLYIIFRLIQKKPIKIIQNVLDLSILLLVLSTTIALISNTYISLNGTIQTILQYIYVYFLYLILREIISQKQINKLPNCLTLTFLFFAVIIVFIGIDGITSHQFNNLLEKIGIENFSNGENRLNSIFGNPNVLACFLASILFLNSNQCLLTHKPEIKAMFQSFTLIFILGILLTYSKAILVLFPISFILYILVIKDKKQKMELMQNMILSFLMAFIFLIIFEKLCISQNYLLMWLVLTITIFTNYLLNLLLTSYGFIIKKLVNKKTVLISSLVLLLIITTYTVIAFHFLDALIVFSEDVESDYEAKIIYPIKGNTNYCFKFDIEAKAPKDIENTYTINLIERDIKNQEIKQTEIKFGTYDGIKLINLTTKETTTEVKVEFKSEYPYAQKKLVIRSLFLNEKEIPLTYKYLPTKLIEKIKNINIRYKTVAERVEMIKNALSLSKQNPLTGIGGNGWEYTYPEVQSYSYFAKYVHSYPAKILLEFGILGISSYVVIAIVILKMLITSVKEQNIPFLSVLFAFIFLQTHSLMDIDMEYAPILVYSFALMAILSTTKKNKLPKKYDFLLNSCLCVIAMISLYLSINPSLYYQASKLPSLLLQRNGLSTSSQEYKEINTKIVDIYQHIIPYERYQLLENYSSIIIYTINSNHENKFDLLNTYYEKLLDYAIKHPNDMDLVVTKVYSIIEEIEKQNNDSYNEIIEKFINLLLEECEKIDKELNSNVKKIYEQTKQIKNKYLLGVKIINDSNIQIDEKELEKIMIEDRCNLLLYHTHGTESYRSSTPYDTYDFYKSLDENYNVIKIGDYLTQLLIEKNIPTIHNETLHNYPSKIGTYANSRKTVSGILAQNETINKIIDIHRDSYSNEEHQANTIEIDGKEVALLRFVVGINKTDPDWLYDLKWVIEMQKLANEKYPGLFKPILIREEDYNQDLSKYATLIEVGENCNTIEHALNSIKYFSEIIK